MCGIVGAIAKRNVTEILLEGLKRLEYRGYDSAGLAILHPNTHAIQRVRVLGKVANLEDALLQNPVLGFAGIAHTRWATHGKPSEWNAHPHCSHNEVSVVHNGIIENHAFLREKLQKMGYQFDSETDTEVICHLVHHYSQSEKNPLRAIRLATQELKGAYALGILLKSEPEKLFAVRSGSPLVIGIGIGENFIASDTIALLPVTQKFVYLEEGDIAELTTHSRHIENAQDEKIDPVVHLSQLDANSTSKGQFRHYMLKEIYEQPRALLNTISAENFDAVTMEIFQSIRRVLIVACGTSYHAGAVAKQWIESLAQLPCQIEIASENRYRDIVVEPQTLLVAISQSGETADTLAALRQAKTRGFSATLGICNAPESTLAREADVVLLTRAGTEIGVAATKTFTAQLACLLQLAIHLGQAHHMPPVFIEQLTKDIQSLPILAEQVLTQDAIIQKMALDFNKKEHALFLGRGTHHAIAMEGALKLKEISYMHAEAYAAGELKHGPLALIDHGMPVIVLAPHNALLDKLESNIQEVQARGAKVYVVCDKNTHWQHAENLQLILMPEMPEVLTPILYTIPLQLLAYHIAVQKGTDIDQPRNLAKSVTVE